MRTRTRTRTYGNTPIRCIQKHGKSNHSIMTMRPKQKGVQEYTTLIVLLFVFLKKTPVKVYIHPKAVTFEMLFAFILAFLHRNDKI